MAHEPTRTFEQALLVGDLGTADEADVDVRGEGIDVRERRITHTGRGMAVMHSPGHRLHSRASLPQPVGASFVLVPRARGRVVGFAGSPHSTVGPSTANRLGISRSAAED